MWLPLIFATSVFIGAFLIAQWGTTVYSSPAYELVRSCGAKPNMRPLAAVAEGDAEPVRLGAAPEEGDG
jgi:hypothetical protein